MEARSLTPGTAPLSKCDHCGNALPRNPSRSVALGLEGRVFCCNGCRAVAEILHGRGLDQYYELRQAAGFARDARPAESTGETFAYLDDPEFLRLYSRDGRMDFYLDGIHCVACVWLLEKIPQFVPGVRSVRLDFGRSLATVTLAPEGHFAAVAREFDALGYRPHPVTAGQEVELQKAENRRMMVKLAVAGACTGNLMLLAISLYSGVGGRMAEVFRWLSLGLFLPVAVFSARPFYSSAWAAVRSGRLSIDVPIVAGIVLGSGASVFNLFHGGDIYFDSLSALVFLLLSSRYVLRRTQQAAIHSSSLMHFLTPSSARKLLQSGEVVECRVDALAAGDVVLVRVGEAIPVDGVVIGGESTLNCALLTGESALVPVHSGSVVFAGTENQQSTLEVQVTASGASTRLGAILRSMETESARRAPVVAFADRMARDFVLVVLASAAAVFGYEFYRRGFQPALNRTLALVIVTCPCALALATPLAMIMSLGRAARRGILIKGADIIERLHGVKEVFLDKTGTLTEGRFEVVRWMVDSTTSASAAAIADAVAALESRSNHPVAQALVRFISELSEHESGPSPVVVENFEEKIGRGVSGTVRGHRFEVRALGADSAGKGDEAGTAVAVFRDGRIVARALLGDRIREDSATAIRELSLRGLTPYVLSGDAAPPTNRIAGQLGIPESRCFSGCSPEDKRSVMLNHPNALMVGDGANDAVALAAAHVSVATHGSMEISLRAADVYLHRSGVRPVIELVDLSHETMRVVRRNFAFSILYNAAGAAAAIAGYVNPLFAAVLMPLSAFTVFFSSILGTKALRRMGDSR